MDEWQELGQPYLHLQQRVWVCLYQHLTKTLPQSYRRPDKEITAPRLPADAGAALLLSVGGARPSPALLPYSSPERCVWSHPRALPSPVFLLPISPGQPLSEDPQLQVGVSDPVCQLPLPHSGCRVTSSPNTPALPHLRGGVQEHRPGEAGDGIKDLKLRLLLGCREDPGLQQKPSIHLCVCVCVCVCAGVGVQVGVAPDYSR